MADVFPKIIACEQHIINTVKATGQPVHDAPHFDWLNLVFKNESYRRAHIDTVDVRESKKLFMTHICIFPQLHNNAPIFGFDIICGPKLVTGAFHDFSCSSIADHPMCVWFAQHASQYTWVKTRELPEWAKNIFSPHMIAASNVNTDAEMDQVIDIVKQSLDYYLKEVSKYDHTANPEVTLERHNWYCKNQKQNPHTPRVMAKLGLNPDDVHLFIDKCLFPEVTS